VASLALAVVFARKRSRIRVGFDLGRAAVGIVAILVMAAVAQVTTPVGAIIAAVVVGAGLGFAQGSSLEISPGERGFYARRSPLGIVLWGAGIVIMQTAGIASRAGTVRIGQTISWFSACLGIGLMVGRKGPMENAKKALAGAGVAVIVAVVVAPALIVGTATPAAAQTLELTDDDVCGLLVPETSDRLAATNTYDPLPGRNFPAYAQDTDPLAQIINSTAACRQEGYEVYTGQGWITYTVYLFASVEDARAQYNAEVAANEAWYAPEWERAQEWFEVYETGFYGIGTGPLDEFDVTGTYWIAAGEQRVIMTAGPFMLYGVVTDDLAFNYGPVRPDRTHEPDDWLIETLITPMADTTHNIEAFLATTEASIDGGEGSSLLPGEGGDDTAGGGDSESIGVVPASGGGDDDEPIDPEKAAAQAIAGLIAAAAMGAITWAEAGAEIGRILGGGPIPPYTRATVVLTGAQAEEAISRGAGHTVDIPKEQQTRLTASTPGGVPITASPIGSTGIVRSVGPIARGPDGSVSVSVEVDAFDPPPPPSQTDGVPPLPDIDEIYEPPPDAEMAPPRPPAVEPPPLPPVDEIYEPPSDPEPLPPRPPAVEPPPLPPVDEIYEPPPDAEMAPPRPPADEPPPEPPPVDGPPPEPPLDDTLTEEDLRDPEFRKWLEDQQRFQGDLADYYRGGTAWQWFEWGTETMVEGTYIGADWSISLLSNLTGPAGKLIGEAWDVSKHAATAAGRTMVDGKWKENLGRATVEYGVDKAWGWGFKKVFGKVGLPERAGVGDQFSRIKINDLVSSNLDSAAWQHMAEGTLELFTDKAHTMLWREKIKNWTGIFEWSPPWPNLP
jgi:hypothetical protein